MNSKAGSWSLQTLLELHTGLLDHAEDVRVSAMNTLLDIAAKGGAPVGVTPFDMISLFPNAFTHSSRMWVTIISRLVAINTPAADGVLTRMISGASRNDDFEAALSILKEQGRTDLLRAIQMDSLSKGRQAHLKRLLGLEVE